MNNPNIGWLFYKNYYNNGKIVWKEKSENDKKANAAVFEDANRKIFQQTLPDVSPYHYPPDVGLDKEGFKTFELQTTYPGLLIGTGYTHGTNLMGEVKLGFYFDHTTGLPIIPGSSVKGMLRSLFPVQDQQRAAKCVREAAKNDKNEKPEEALRLLEKSKQYAELSKQKEDFIRSLLPHECQHINLSDLERQIFGNTNGDYTGNSAGNDVFHDAILVKSLHPKYKNFPNGCFLGEDFITPHKNTKKDANKLPDELVNPTPLMLLKVLPAVTFRFQFQLQNHYYTKNKEGKMVKIPFLLTVQQRANLFCTLLTTIGIGAKTNVGYGQFTSSK